LRSQKILNILTHPLFLFLVLSTIIIISLPPIFNKYETKLISKLKTLNPIVFEDLNYDGDSEKISIVNINEQNTGIIIEENGRTIDQWNFEGNYQKILVGDYDKNGNKEIHLITFSENKVFLNSFDPMLNQNLITNKLIYTSENYLKKGSALIKSCGFYDLDNDGINEICFAINADYLIYPRNLFAYNFSKDTVLVSPESCNTVGSPFAFDFDGDGNLEFASYTQAVGNCDANDPYTDMFTWLMVFDHNLNFEFAPTQIGYYPSRLQVGPFMIGTELLLAVLNLYNGAEGYSSSISLYNSDGKKIKEKEFVYSSDWDGAIIFNSTNNYEQVLTLKMNGIIERLDTNLNFSTVHSLEAALINGPYPLDIDSDNFNEFIFLKVNEEELVITRNDFSHPLILDVAGNTEYWESYNILNGDQRNQFYVICNNYSYLYEYTSNPFFYFRYLIYAGIIVLLFLLVLLIQKTQNQRVQKKYESERKIAELQLMSIKNQTDPHFTLNILNSIGSLFYKQDAEQANYIFGKYSKLLRNTILSSDKILTSLESELDYVENYLSLEKFRLANKFDYKINIDNAIDPQLKIPKTLVHTFVENAVKHGLRHLKSVGSLDIVISKSSSSHKVSIRDNGIGRKTASEITTYSTGKGLEILDHILKLHYELEKIKITYKIIDHFDENNSPTGTEVLITIPSAKK
jgi:hypothetical protein